MTKYKLNQMEPAQKQSLKILVGKTSPDQGIVIEPIARPVFRYADKWVHWVGATPK